MNRFDILCSRSAKMCIAAGALLAASFLGGMSSPAAAADSQATTYSGDIWQRSTLTGDWGGYRNDLADKGLTFDANLTNVTQSVIDGGKTHEWEYGGRSALNTVVDTGKLGLWPGGFFTLELEGNWKNAITARETGALMPVNSNQLWPEPTNDNFNVPELSFAQFVSHYVGFFLGKLDTLSGDANAFAHGKGDKQFMNLALNINPTLVITTPYSTLGTGVIVLPTADPEQSVLQFSVLQANGKASTSGFEDLSADKLTFAAQGRVRIHFFDMVGHQLLGAVFSNRSFKSLDQRLENVVAGGNAIAKEDNSWAVYYNFDQYLYQPDAAVDRGIGMFGRIGFADGNPNPMQTFVSFGLGGKGPCEPRANDSFGVGYYFIDVKSPTLRQAGATRSFLRDESGFEAYYRIALTPWAFLTLDLQTIRGSQKREIGTGDHVPAATVLGIRQEIVF